MGGALAHVELSLTESFIAQPQQVAVDEDTLQRWAEVVRHATEPSLIIDDKEAIIAVSSSCCELLGLGNPAGAAGRYLLDEVRLIDFTANQTELTEPELAGIPPLLAVTSGRLARGLLRVGRPGLPPITVDAIATPLREDGLVVGSLSFFAKV